MKRRLEAQIATPAASIVMPTHSRRGSLARVLHALDRQSVPRDLFEVVVVCDGDVDGSYEACLRVQGDIGYRLRAVVQDNQGPAAARNRGVAEAEGELIIFLDDDVVPDEGLVAAHLAAQRGHDSRVTIGPLLPPLDARLSPWAAWEERTLLRQYDDMIAARWEPTYRQFYTGNASVLKRHIQLAGGFNPAFQRAEDVELARRLADRGLHFVFLPEARGWHYIQRSYGSWSRAAEAYGRADVAMARAGYIWALTIAAEEYRNRNRLTRVLAQIVVGRPRVAGAILSLLYVWLRATRALRAERLSYALCSIVFNLRYYKGLAAALGGRATFIALLRSRDAAAALNGPSLAFESMEVI